MAVYGLDFYGLSKYGPNQAQAYDVSPFEAKSIDYGHVFVSWTNPPDSMWTELRLIKNNVGAPVHENDGEIILSQTDPVSRSFLDTNPVPGEYAYYAIFLDVGDSWARAGVTHTLNIRDFGYTDWLLERLPDYYKIDSGGELTTDSVGNPYIEQFISVFGWGSNLLKSQYEMARNVNDAYAVNLVSLDAMAKMLGIEYSPEVQSRVMRDRVSSSAHVGRQKGTTVGWRNLINTISALDADVTVGKNLMLNDDQASFAHPQYPDWSPYINYPVGDRVHYNGFWYQTNTGGAYGTSQKPSGTLNNNTWWTCIKNTDSTFLLNPTTAGQSTWEAESLTPGVTVDRVRASLSVGVESPQDPNILAYNAIMVKNMSTSSSADLVLRSVSKRVVQRTNLYNTITNTATSINVFTTVGMPTTYPAVVWLGFDSPAQAEAIVLTQAPTGSTMPYTYANVQRGALGTTARGWSPGTQVWARESTLYPQQAITNGIPIPWPRLTREWDGTTEYKPGDMVLYAERPYVALTASQGITPPYPQWDTPNDQWAAVGLDSRPAMMLSGYTHQPFDFPSKWPANVYPFVEWYDVDGKLITSVTGRSDYTEKKQVRLATSGPLPASSYFTSPPRILASGNGSLTVDGVTTSVGQRVLVKNQANATQNGIYQVTNAGSSTTQWQLTRASDFDESSEMVTGSYVVVVQTGVANSNKLFALTTPPPITMGVTPLTFAEIQRPEPPSGLAFDSFSDDWAEDSLTGRVMDTGGYSWTTGTGSWTTDGFRRGSVHPTTPGVRSTALMTGDANCALSLTFRTAPQAGEKQGLLFRYSTDQNYWRADRAGVWKRVAGTYTQVGTYPSPFLNNDRITVKLNGSSITVYKNGGSTPVLSITDSFNSSATQHGMVVE